MNPYVPTLDEVITVSGYQTSNSVTFSNIVTIDYIYGDGSNISNITEDIKEIFTKNRFDEEYITKLSK